MPIRFTPYLLMVVLMTASFIYSTAIQTGHADVPIAESAGLIDPLGKGDPAPRFIVRTVDGGAFDFDPENLERPVVLLAYRGGWCPFCNTYLSEIRHAIPEIRELGVDVLFLSGDRPDQLFASLKLETQQAIDGFDYTLLSDSDAQAAVALGIAFKVSSQTINGRREKQQDIDGSSMLQHGVLPVPAVFAIDRYGEIRFAYTNANYKIRLPVEQLLTAAREIAAAD